MNEYINLTLENIDEEYIFCATSLQTFIRKNLFQM